MSEAYIPSIVQDEDVEFFEKGDFGGRLGWGTNAAVVVVDMTREFTTDEFSLGRATTARKAIDGIERLLETARSADVPIYFTKPMEELPEGYPGTTKAPPDLERRRAGGNEIHPDIEPTEGEYVITKPRASAFYDTHFSNMLRRDDVDTLVVTGMTTSGCVRGTVVDACSGNLKPVVPKECVADRATASHEISLFDMDMKYADVVELDWVLDHLET